MDSYWIVLPANNAVATIRDVASRAIRQTENEMRAKLPLQAVVAQLSPPPATDTLTTNSYDGSVDYVGLSNLYCRREDNLRSEA